MDKQKKSGNSMNIGGSVSGQIIQGDDNVQVHSVSATREQVTDEDIASIRQMLAELKAAVEAEAPPEKKEEALKQVEELGEAITDKEPDLDRFGGIRSWFKRNVPKVAGAVVGVIVNPIVGKVVEAAGEGLAAEVQRRFGKKDDR